jgi:hypothetical protein
MAVRVSTLETLFFCFWYSFLLEAEYITRPSAAGRISQIERIHSPYRDSKPDFQACSIVSQSLCYGQDQEFSFLHIVQTQAPVQLVPQVHSPGVKRLAREADHLPPSVSEVKNPSPLQVVLAWCSIS